jgi:hypothetical protein
MRAGRKDVTIPISDPRPQQSGWPTADYSAETRRKMAVINALNHNSMAQISVVDTP